MAADFGGAVAEVSCCEEEEGDPEQQEDAEDRLAEAEGDDPEQESEDSPHEQDGASGCGWRGFEPSGSDGPLEEGEPPPEESVGGEGDHSEGIAGAELEDACDDLGDSAVGEG